MSEWLDLMLEEIARKRRESQQAQDELSRRREEGPTQTGKKKSGKRKSGKKKSGKANARR